MDSIHASSPVELSPDRFKQTTVKVVPYTPGKILICSFNFLILLAVCLNISTVINIKILANSNQQTQSYKFTSHIAAFLSVVLIIEMLEICIQTSYDQSVQLILKSYLPVVYGIGVYCFSTKNTAFRIKSKDWLAWNQYIMSEWSDMSTHRVLFQ
jgi:hypothetical protein